MKKRNILLITLSLFMTITLAACSTKPTDTQNSNTFPACQQQNPSQNSGQNSTETISDPVSLETFDFSLSKKDQNTQYDETAATKIVFSSTGITVSGSGAVSKDGVVTINAEGTYILSGSGEGEVLVELDGEDAKAQLVLMNLDLSNSNGPAILVGSADKVIITVPEGTESTLSDGTAYTVVYDESEVDAAIFSKDDLTINGTGTLNVTGNYSHGIVGKDDLVIYQTNVNVNAVGNGLQGKDSLLLIDCSVTAKAGNDALKSNNDEDEDKGYVYISNSNITAEATDKGIVGEKLVYIESGNINVKSADDSIHSNSTIQIDNGSITVSTDDDGIHADALITINGGTINVNKALEGIEAQVITVNDGNINVNASDDGLNCGGSSNTANTGSTPFGGSPMMDTNSNASLTINGGTLTVNAQGDGLDSNGYLTINGGTIYVNGPTNSGNGSLDTGISSSITGGTLLALGSSGMNERITNVTQGTIIVDISSQKAGSLFELVDESGNVIVSYTAEKNFSNVTVSSPDIKKGATYTIKINGNAVTSVTMDDLQYFNAQGMVGQGGSGGNHSGGRR